MIYILPKASNFEKKQFAIKKDYILATKEGSKYNISIFLKNGELFVAADDTLPITAIKDFIKVQLPYSIKPYDMLTYTSLGIVTDITSLIKQANTNFTIIVDESDYVKPLNFIQDVEDSNSRTIFGTYSTIKYCTFDNISLPSNLYLHLDTSQNNYHMFRGFVKPRHERVVIIMPEYFVFINNKLGYFNINGIFIYFKTKHIFTNSQLTDITINQTPTYSNVEFANIDRATLNCIYFLLIKNNLTLNINTKIAKNDKDDSSFAFITPTTNTFDLNLYK